MASQYGRNSRKQKKQLFMSILVFQLVPSRSLIHGGDCAGEGKQDSTYQKAQGTVNTWVLMAFVKYCKKGCKIR